MEGNEAVQRPRRGLAPWVMPAALVLAAAAAITAKVSGAPSWLVLVAAGVGAVVVPAGNLLRSAREQRVQDDADQRRLVSPIGGLVRDRSTTEVGVHRPVRTDIPYIERDVQDEVVERLDFDRKVLIAGPSMAGKTRLAFSVVQMKYGDLAFYRPADGASLRELWARGSTLGPAVVWLDDMDLFVSAGGLSAADLEVTTRHADVVVVATIRGKQYEKLQPTGEFKPPGWDVASWFGEPVWLSSWSESELDRLESTPTGPLVRAEARTHGLSNYLGGAPLLETRLAIGRSEASTGYALVQAAADWRRVGMATPVSTDELVALLPTYAPGGRFSARRSGEFDTALGWALEQVGQAVALLEEHGTGFRAPDIVLDRLAQGGAELPDELWEVARRAASIDELVSIGTTAFFLARFERAESLFEAAAEFDGDPGEAGGLVRARALLSLAITQSELDRPEDEIATYDRLVTRFGDDPDAALREHVAKALVNKGVTLADLGRVESAVDTYDRLSTTYGDDPAPAVREPVANGLMNKAVTLSAANRPEEALATFDLLIVKYRDDTAPDLRELVANALLNKGVTLREVSRPEDCIAINDLLIDAYRNDPALREQVAKAIVNKGITQSALNRHEDAIASYDNLIEAYHHDLLLRKQVAKAMVNKGIALSAVDRLEEAISINDLVVVSYRDEPDLRVQVADALFNKGVILHNLGNHDDAIAIYDDLASAHDKDAEPGLREVAASALAAKATVLQESDRATEAVEILRSIVSRFSDDSAADEVVSRARRRLEDLDV